MTNISWWGKNLCYHCIRYTFIYHSQYKSTRVHPWKAFHCIFILYPTSGLNIRQRCGNYISNIVFPFLLHLRIPSVSFCIKTQHTALLRRMCWSTCGPPYVTLRMWQIPPGAFKFGALYQAISGGIPGDSGCDVIITWHVGAAICNYWTLKA